MTPEKLEELEKLEAEAQPGADSPWPTYLALENFEEALLNNARDLFAALREAWAALEEREGDMHVRIREGYDKTVADSWRAHCAKIEKERDEARAALKPSGHDVESCCCPDCCTLREAREEVARLKEQLQQATEKAAMFHQAAEDWRYIAKQYQDARKKESAAYEQAEIEALERLAALGCVCEGSESRVCVACRAQDALKKEA